MEMISALIEFTGLNIEEVYNMPAIDAFVYLSFINERNNRKWLAQKQELEKQKARMNRIH